MKTTEQAYRSFGKRREPAQISISSGGRVRAVSLSPTTIVATLACLAVFTVAYLGSTAYLFFRDDIIAATLARQGELQVGYEDRIVALRAQIDRINSRRLLDQDAFEAKIDRLLARQEVLKAHEEQVSAVLERARQQGVRLPTAAATGEADKAIRPAAPLKASSWLDAFAGRKVATAGATGPEETRVAAAEASIETLAQRQALAVAAVAELAERNASRIEKVVGRLGLKLAAGPRVSESQEPTPQPKPARAPGLGGPLVPVADPLAAIRRAEAAVDRLVTVKRSVSGLPLGTPVRGDPQVTSGFGNRSDPFLGVLAMHTGIDFRAETGDAVVATGKGLISEAGRQGGYGLMVEVDHGNGVTTRFGHLSRIAVEVGQPVKRGQVVGYAGSTGRSTGPHVHYETRLNGDPVNPTGWLDAGEELRPVLD